LVGAYYTTRRRIRVLDDKGLTGWNGLAVAAFAVAP